MPIAISTDLPLETLLKEYTQSRRSEFPHRQADYFLRYTQIKQYLADTYYRNAGAGLARDGDRFTLHDIGHVDDVIQKAGQLLGLDSEARTPMGQKLSPYEIYALLVAILLHDAGNASGRHGHEKAPKEILEELGPVADLTPFERRVIGQIAEAHGGRTPTGDKDTIGIIVSPAVADIENVRVHGRKLAAILRLADELSENPRRADSNALRRPYQAPQSVLPNLFCSIISISVDYVGRSIGITFLIEKALLSEVFVAHSDGKTKLLVDYLIERLEKCELERRYCNRFLSNFLSYDRIRVTVDIVDGFVTMEQIAFDLEDTGYPQLTRIVASVAPDFLGSKLQSKYSAAENA